MTLREAIAIAYREMGHPEEEIKSRFTRADMSMGNRHDAPIAAGKERKMIEEIKKHAQAIRNLPEEEKEMMRNFLRTKMEIKANLN